MSTHRFVSMEPCKVHGSGCGEHVITIEEQPSAFRRFFGGKPLLRQFHGDCTIWYELPDFRSAGTLMTCMLLEFWQRARHERMKV